MEPIVVREDQISPSILAGRQAIFKQVEAMCKTQIKWYECDTPAAYREMRLNGTNGFSKPQFYDGARQISIRGRDGHTIDLRIISPSSVKPRGVLLHFHAGGMVIGTARSYDSYLVKLAEALAVTAVSVEYRLAPENEFPAARNDCIDAALYALSPEGERELGGPLRVLAGESAGGTLAVWVAIALRDLHGIAVRSQLAALLPSCGMFDLTGLPSLYSHKGEAILSGPDMLKFIEASFPHVPTAARRNPDISPLYANLSDLPPAIFLCGTEDPLVDDSIFMAIKWAQAGNTAELALLTGSPHVPMLFPWGELTEVAISRLVNFIDSRL